jgi:hypothetical protein
MLKGSSQSFMDPMPGKRAYRPCEFQVFDYPTHGH